MRHQICTSITQDDIFSALDDLKVSYDVLAFGGLEESGPFQFASLKNRIRRGIYFVVGDPPGLDGVLGSIILTDGHLVPDTCTVIQTPNPQLAHYRLTKSFLVPRAAMVHPSVIIEEPAKIGRNLSAGPYSVLGDCEIGDDVVLGSHVVIEDGVTLGDNVVIDSGSVIGAAGIAWIWDEGGHRVLQPQIGGVVVEDDCILGTDVTIVRGSLSENTRIGQGTVISHGSKIGHGCQLGAHVHLANNISLAGNVRIGDRAFLGSSATVAPGIHVPANSVVGASALVSKDFEEEYLTLGGVPAKILKRQNYAEKPSGVPQSFKGASTK